MKARHSLFLVLVLALLIGLYAGTRYRDQHRAEQLRVARQVFSFADADIQRLSIKRVGEEASIAERLSETDWHITAPNPTILPFHSMWNRVAGRLATLSNEHTVLESPSDLAPYGLDTPALEIEAVLSGGSSIRLCFGDVEPTQRCRYARVDQGSLFLVGVDTFFELNRSLYDLRHRYLVEDRDVPLLQLEFAWIWTGPPKEEQGRRIETGDESITIMVERASKEAPWRVVAPFQALARHEKVEEVATALQFAVGKEFIDRPENLADYGLSPAKARISFPDPKSGKRKTLWLGAAEESTEHPGLFVKILDQDGVFVIESPLLNLLPTTPVAWRDLRLLTRRVSDIKELIYTRGPGRFVLDKAPDGAWRLAEPALEALNALAINAFLTFIKEVEGDDFVENEGVQKLFESPETRIALHFDDGSTSEILLARNTEEPEKCYARQDNGAVVSLSGVAVDMLHIDENTFRSLEVLRFSKTDIRDLTLLYGGRKYELTRRHNLWVATAPENFQIKNQSDIGAVINAVCPLRASGIADTEDSSADPAKYGLDNPVLVLTITPEPSAHAEAVTLEIGGVNEDNPSERFARSSMRTGIYKINQEVMDKLREAMREFQ